MPSQYAGQVFEFQHKRLAFIDAVKDDGTQVGPMIIDKKGGPQHSANYEEMSLTDTGAFILDFVLQRVDSDLIAQIYASEYGLNDVAAATTEVDNFITSMVNQNLLKATPRKTKTHSNPGLGTSKQFTGLSLNFDVDLNPMGGYRIKRPT